MRLLATATGYAEYMIYISEEPHRSLHRCCASSLVVCHLQDDTWNEMFSTYARHTQYLILIQSGSAEGYEKKTHMISRGDRI